MVKRETYRIEEVSIETSKGRFVTLYQLSRQKPIGWLASLIGLNDLAWEFVDSFTTLQKAYEVRDAMIRERENQRRGKVVIWEGQI
jgi:hypothetical protein